MSWTGRAATAGIKHWKLQYASSLYAHKDWKRAWGHLTPGQGNALALLGNCCSVATPTEREYSIKFLRECSKAWDTVYVVPGPHELSSGAETGMGNPFFTQLDTLKGVMKDASGKRENVYFMQHGEHSLLNKDIVVLSATAWTGDAPFKRRTGARFINCRTSLLQRGCSPRGIRKILAGCGSAATGGAHITPMCAKSC